jgi:hypothetical protein
MVPFGWASEIHVRRGETEAALDSNLGRGNVEEKLSLPYRNNKEH